MPVSLPASRRRASTVALPPPVNHRFARIRSRGVELPAYRAPAVVYALTISGIIDPHCPGDIAPRGPIAFVPRRPVGRANASATTGWSARAVAVALLSSPKEVSVGGEEPITGARA